MDKKQYSRMDKKQYYDKRRRSGLLERLGNLSIDRRARKYFIISSINANMRPPLEILDLGCGSGWLTKILSEFGNVTGIDLSLGVAKKLHPNLKFVEADIITDEIEGKYNVIVSSEVIEHLITEDQHIFFKKCYSLLKENGFLILTTPNKTFTEKVLKSAGISRNQQQLIENRLDETSLVSLLKPYFKIKFVGPVFSHSFFLTKLLLKYRLFHWAMSFIPLFIYKFFDELIGQEEALRLGVVAQKLGSQDLNL